MVFQSASASKKFHIYIYGRHTTIQNDHKPLVMIQHKPNPSHMSHLQCMLHCLQKYNFTIMLNIISGAVEWDSIHNILYHLTLNKWPKWIHPFQQIAQHFRDTKDELSIEDGLLIKGVQICIPLELYDRTLADLHDSHQGTEKMQLLNKQLFFFLAQHGCQYCWLCQKMQSMHQAHDNQSITPHASLKLFCWPMARPHHWCLHTSEQWVPTYC